MFTGDIAGFTGDVISQQQGVEPGLLCLSGGSFQ